MSAFGHAGFGSPNRRNQLRAQGQIGGQDQYGNQVRKAMQPPAMAAYRPPQSYQQNTGQQTTTNTTGARTSTPSGGTVSVSGGSPMPTPGTAQPIQPTSLGTPYGEQAVTGGDFPTYPTQPTGLATPDGSQPPIMPGGKGADDPRLRYMAELGGQGNEGGQTTGYATPGTAQPIQPPSQGTPYGASQNSETWTPPFFAEEQPNQSAASSNTYQQRVDAAAEQWASTPAGSQKIDWAGNTARNMLRRAGPGEDLMDVAQSAVDRLVMNGYSQDTAAARQSVSSALPESMRSQFNQRMQQVDSSAEAERQRLASLPQNQPGYNPFPGGVTLADFYGPNAMQAQYWHKNYNPDGSPRIVGWGSGGIGSPLQPIYSR